MTSNPQDVSGDYAGAVTRLAAHSLDLTVAGLIFVGVTAAFDYVVNNIAGIDWDVNDSASWYAAAAAVWLFLYWWVSISVAGKTLGKALLGLRVVTGEGGILSPTRAAVRAVALPISFLLFGLGFLGIVIGRKRRALHDVIAGSAVIYDWGERTAQLPMPISAYLDKKSADVAPTVSDPSDEAVANSDSSGE